MELQHLLIVHGVTTPSYSPQSYNAFLYLMELQNLLIAHGVATLSYRQWSTL